MTTIGRIPPVEGAAPVWGARRWLADRPRSGPERGRRRHAGVDLAVPAGTVVRAPEAGTIVTAGRAEPSGAPASELTPGFSGYGPAVIVLRGADVWHLLGHLAWPLEVDAGEEVAEGAELGRVSELAHVHWEVRTRQRPGQDPTATITLDPLAWLRGEARPYDPAHIPERDDPTRERVPPGTPPPSSEAPPPRGPRRAPVGPARARRGGLGWVALAGLLLWALGRRGRR